MLKWYVAQTHVHKESLAAVNLKNQGFDSYIPRYKKTRRHARKTEEILAPLFPGYMFIQLDISKDRWRSIHSTRGIKQLICVDNNLPTAIPDNYVNALKSQETKQHILPSSYVHPYNEGDHIRITQGNFTDHIATVKQLKDSDRVALLLEFMKRHIEITLPLSAVEAA